TIGVFAHELGHALFGLPDLYDRDESSNGVDDWSLMASGVWLGPLGSHPYMGTSPSQPDAWSRIQMGYAAAQNVTVDLLSESIVNVSSSPDIYRLWTYGNASNEYFLIENRQRVGYDYYLPSGGLLVYHIDESITSQNDNEWYPGYTTSSHYLVAVEQADGAYNLEKGDWADDGDPFPGSSQNAEFYNFSSPSSRAYSGTHTGIFLTNISSSGDTMWVDMSVTPGQKAQISSVSDVPADQGGEVLVTWNASTDESNPQRPVVAYGIWLKDTDDGILLSSWPMTQLEDGDWIQVRYTDSVGKMTYQWNAPTLVDSNHLGLNRSTFRIAAYAADSLIVSLSESFDGHSVDNLAPAIPQGLTAESSGGDGILLTWNANPDSDLAAYRIYRGESPDFLPVSRDSFLAATMDTTYHDTGPTPGQLYYRVLAMDVNGNTSEYSAVTDPVTIVAAHHSPRHPAAFALHPNYPNPFNPQTTIRFDVPQNSWIRMSIHDIRGREIARLVDGLLQPGSYAETWDGTSQSGLPVPSGLYITRLTSPGMSRSIKMLLLK
ncbi:MAG: immune inhibitor A, partial [Fidelibacterota bacterium]